LKKVALCRKNVNVMRRPGIKPGLLYTSSTPTHRYSMRVVCSDAPKGARGKHKTHKNREFCKTMDGVKDYCKNQFNYD
jgi:hypothetical protein